MLCRAQVLRASLLRTVLPGSPSAVARNILRWKSKKHSSELVQTATLTPASQLKVGTEEGQREYDAAKARMQAAVAHLKRELAVLETRGSGRVTPALLDPVRVQLPNGPESGQRLQDVATVGVREGTTLIVTMFDEGVRMLLTVDLGSLKRPRLSSTSKKRSTRPNFPVSFRKKLTQ